MKFRKIVSAFLSAAFMTVVVLTASSTVDAQGRFVNQYSRADVDNIIRRMEENSDEFRTDFRSELNNSGLNSSTRNRYNGYVAASENAIDQLRRNFDRNNSWWESRSQVRNVVSASQNVNNMMRSLPFRRQIERQWNQLRNQINRVADTYDLPGLDGGGWQGGGGGGGGGGAGNVPNWAVGTFYGRNPQSGGTITLSVQRNGAVSILFDGGEPIQAFMNRTTLTNGPYVSRVTRLNNGIRTTDVSNGSYIDYFTTPVGGGGGNIPNWAVGTFYGRNPQTGGTIALTVQRNGNVTISFDGGAPVYASMNGTTLTNGQYVSRVTRTNNGIRTTDVTNGSYIDYRRR
jgi:hypothetical protein